MSPEAVDDRGTRRFAQFARFFWNAGSRPAVG